MYELKYILCLTIYLNHESPTSPAGGMLFSFVLWGGMVFSGAMIFMHTQQMIHQAESHPGKSWNGTGRDYDPINASLGLYIAMINMFQRMVSYLQVQFWPRTVQYLISSTVIDSELLENFLGGGVKIFLMH